MATAKKAITSSNESYLVKVFDLYSDSRSQPRVPVNKYTFKSTEYGWKTLNISGEFYKPPSVVEAQKIYRIFRYT